MAAICAICKTQFAKVMPYYGFSMDRIVSLHQLVGNAIVLDDAETGGTGGNAKIETDNGAEGPAEVEVQDE
jgi:hypothetical protein